MNKYLILSSSISRNSGGVYEVLRNLYPKVKGNVTVLGIQDVYTAEDKFNWKDVQVISYKSIGLRSFGYSSGFNKLIKRDQYDIIHLHGLWMYNQYFALKWQKRKKIPVVISPHGMLDSWALKNSKWKKKLISLVFGNKSLRKSNCIHALCHAEYESIRRLGMKNPIAILPNGIDLPNEENLFVRKSNSRKKLLFLGRIHPKKGLTNLIKAIAILNNNGLKELSNWEICIAGWSQLGYQEQLTRLVNEYGLADIVTFVGAVFGQEKDKILREADGFILPSFSEGLPMSVLEAWAYKLPVIMTEECNLPEGFRTNSALKIETNAENIAYQLNKFFLLTTKERSLIGKNGYELVKSEFTWEVIGEKFDQLYEWILNDSETPNFVCLD